jgi:hypothetical protein
MAIKLLVSAGEVKQLSRISASLDDALIRPVIQVAQFTHILPLLGGGLYDKLIADHPTWTGAYEALMDNYVQPCLIQWVLVEGLEDWHYRIEGGAVGTRQSDNMNPASEPEISRLQDSARRRAEKYAVQCIDYLCRNASSFPEYGASGAVSGLVCPATTQDYLTGGMEIGRRNKQSELKRWQYDRRR